MIAEVNAVARSHMEFEIVPGLPATSAVPTMRACPWALRTPSPMFVARSTGGAGSGPGAADPHRDRVASVRRRPHPDRVRARGRHAVRGDLQRHHLRAASVETTLQGLTDRATLSAGAAGADPGAVVRRIGGDHRADGREPGQIELVGEPRAVRLERSAPRTKDQAGEMCDRLVSHGALPIEVPTIAVEPRAARPKWKGP